MFAFEKKYEVQVSIEITKTMTVTAESIEDAEAYASEQIYDDAITEITIDHSEEVGESNE